MIRRLLLTLILLGASGLSACSRSRTYVLDPVRPDARHDKVAIQRGASTVTVDDDAAKAFETTLKDKLKSEAMIGADDAAPLIIRYRFVLFDTGSTAARVGSGVAGLVGSPFYGIGDGALGVEATFTEPSGQTLGRILVDGPVSGAFASTDSAIDAAATSIARYAKANFGKPEPVTESLAPAE